MLVPQVSVSTAEIFSDPLLTRNSSPIKVRPVPKGNSRNDCLPVVARRYPDVRNALNLLGKFTEAKLTGTGSCVFGGFPSKAEADKVSALLTETLTGFVAKEATFRCCIASCKVCSKGTEYWVLVATDTGASPSGKAAGFDPAMRWFESSRPCHFLYSSRLPSASRYCACPR